ncbi:hypothetical protein DPMN_077865 [Dreissena polymorpha]|uniref:Uncharacterized protein n=1 Tax=Dreissena polymorpha TaxID=45954 RepID=A0A9D3YL85_DREPO|nr:hypothetical protein DPMN_077865 [Dreissena polymorpha]
MVIHLYQRITIWCRIIFLLSLPVFPRILCTSLVPDSDADIDTDQYLVSINQIYELMFQTLGEDYCSRPVEVSTNSTISVTEQLVRTFDPNRVTKASSRVDIRLPIGSSVLSVFQSLESVNKTILKRVEIWKVPKDFSEP